MRKFASALVFTVCTVGLVLGADQAGQIYDIKDGKAKFKKSQGKGKFDDPIDITFAAKDVTVKYATKKKMDVTEGDAVEGGLTADAFKNATSEKGLNVIITTADDDVKDGAKKGEVTKVLVLKGKKGA
jgi:hypothetical protein